MHKKVTLLPVFTICISLITLSIAIHAFAIGRILKWKNYLNSHFVSAAGMLLVSHLIHVSLFAVGYQFLSDAESKLIGNLDGSWIDFFYFSLSCYSSLGFGDIYPVGSVRIISGIEALLGLMMIAWSATILYSLIEKIQKK